MHNCFSILKGNSRKLVFRPLEVVSISGTLREYVCLHRKVFHLRSYFCPYETLYNPEFQIPFLENFPHCLGEKKDVNVFFS